MREAQGVFILQLLRARPFQKTSSNASEGRSLAWNQSEFLFFLMEKKRIYKHSETY